MPIARVGGLIEAGVDGMLERVDIVSEKSLPRSGMEETDDSYPEEVTEEAEVLLVLNLPVAKGRESEGRGILDIEPIDPRDPMELTESVVDREEGGGAKSDSSSVSIRLSEVRYLPPIGSDINSRVPVVCARRRPFPVV